jgi:aconitate hydratase
VLTVTQMLRKHGVVGKFVEFFGDGLQHLPLADRATIANMAPEYGATCGIFPIDEESLTYLRLSGRSSAQIALVKAYAQAQGLWHEPGRRGPNTVRRCTWTWRQSNPPWPARSARRTACCCLGNEGQFPREPAVPDPHRSQARNAEIAKFIAEPGAQEQADRLAEKPKSAIRIQDQDAQLGDGSVVIAAITSCTNTSNPAVMLGAGLLARNAVAKGLKAAPWVKTSLGPGSLVVTDYLRKAGVLDDLEQLGFYVVGYGCTTCIGNSGPLPQAVSQGSPRTIWSWPRCCRATATSKAASTRSEDELPGVAAAGGGLCDRGHRRHRPDHRTARHGRDGKPVYLKDIWPTNKEIGDLIAKRPSARNCSSQNYANVFAGDTRWNKIASPDGERSSTGMQPRPTSRTRPTSMA